MEPRSHTVFRGKVQAEIDGRTVHIVSGSAKDFAQHQNDCGYVEGLLTALKLLDETNDDIAQGN